MIRERPFSSAFPTAQCEACGTAVLTHLVMREAGGTDRHCVRCDRRITTAIEWLSAGELEQNGYQIVTPRRPVAGRSGESYPGQRCGSGCACSAK